MTALWITLGVLYGLIAIGMAFLFIEFDRDSWTDEQGYISNFDYHTSFVFGLSMALIWPFFLLVIWMAAAADDRTRKR